MRRALAALLLLATAALAEPNAVTPRKLAGWNRAVSSLDAAYALQAAVGSRVLDAHQFLACDVTGNGRVTSLDAARILQFAVGIIPRLPVAERCGSDWLFLPEPAPVANQTVVQPVITETTCELGRIEYDPLAGIATEQNFTAILFGDCTGNWRPVEEEEEAVAAAG